MSLRERQKKEKVRRIEAAARRLFAEKGYDGTTTREIAREADVATGTLFVYYPEKKDLLFQLFQHDVERVIEEAWKTLPQDAGFVDQVLYVFGRIYDYYERDLELALVFAKELSFMKGGSQDELNAFSLGFVMQLAALVKRAAFAGELGRHVEAGQAAYLLFSLYHLSLVSWVTGFVTRAQLNKQLRTSLELLLRGLAP